MHNEGGKGIVNQKVEKTWSSDLTHTFIEELRNGNRVDEPAGGRGFL